MGNRWDSHCKLALASELLSQITLSQGAERSETWEECPTVKIGVYPPLDGSFPAKTPQIVAEFIT